MRVDLKFEVHPVVLIALIKTAAVWALVTFVM